MRATLALGGMGAAAADGRVSPAPVSLAAASRARGTRPQVKPGQRPTAEQAEAQWHGWSGFLSMAEGAESRKAGA